MRPILSAKEYAAVIQQLSDGELQSAAAVVADAMREMKAQSDLDRAVFLCDVLLQKIARRAAELLTLSGMSVSVHMIGQDVIPALKDALICDLLFSPTPDETSASERAVWLSAMATSGCPIVSVGIPAGVDPDTGRTAVEVAHAQITVAIKAYLPGLFLHEGLDHCGRIWPWGGETEEGKSLLRFEETDAKCLLPPRKRTAHKGDSGKALLCVGSPQYVGAALLSARACLAAGCGILYVACPDMVRAALGRLPEAIGIPVGADWNAKTCQMAIHAISGMKTIGLGCGIGSGDISPLIEAALQSRLPLVLDADGLNCLSRYGTLFALLHEKVVLTPHPGEMSRLTNLSIDAVLGDPVSLAAAYARRWGCTVLLKGAATVVSDGNRTCIIAEGNAGLGKGGSGDVLTGIITGLLSQDIEPFHAACLGSYLLGASADRALDLLKERMLRATNVIEALEEWNE